MSLQQAYAQQQPLRERLVPVDTLAPPSNQQQDNEANRVKVKNSDNAIQEVIDDTYIQYLRGNVKMFHDSIFMYADNAVIKDKVMSAKGNIIIIQEDTINVFADSLQYDADRKLAKLYDKVVMDNDDKQLFTDYLIYDLESKKGTFLDTAILKRQTMTLSSLRGTYDVASKRAFFYDQVVIVDEDFRLTCDSLDYDTDIDRAYFISETYITQGNKQIYCEDGYYDLVQKRAFFTQNAVVREDDQVAIADNILVSESDSIVTLTGAARVEDSESQAEGDEIIFNNGSGDIFINGNGRYENDDNLIQGPSIQYNEKTEDLLTTGRSTVQNEKGLLIADTIEYSKVEDLGYARGTVEWVDTTENRILYSESLYYRDSSEFVKAVKEDLRPLLIQEVDGDSMYVSSDTLISAKPSDTLSYLQAMGQVVIFKSDLQAICDSLYYSDVDSTFTLFGNPICWSDTTQFVGDTIVIALKNDEVSEIIAKKNAFITSKNIGDYYDQIKGRYIHTFLDSNELRLMHIKGNAESIYMIKDDDDAYVGPNKTLCSHMTFYFEDNDLDSIKFYSQPESKMTPMSKATDAELKLGGFLWETKRRPLTSVGLREKQLAGPRKESDLNAPDMDVFETEVMDVINGESNDTDKPESNKETENGAKSGKKS